MNCKVVTNKSFQFLLRNLDFPIIQRHADHPGPRAADFSFFLSDRVIWRSHGTGFGESPCVPLSIFSSVSVAFTTHKVVSVGANRLPLGIGLGAGSWIKSEIVVGLGFESFTC